MPHDRNAATCRARRSPRAAAFVVLGLTLTLAACGPQLRDVTRLSGPTMGTWYNITIVGDLPQDERDAAEVAVEEVLVRIDGLMSTYKPESELSRFNRHDAATPFELSEETLQVLGVAQEVSGRTGGAFDVTVGPLVNAFGFGPEAEPDEMPTQPELDALRERIGYRKLTLQPEDGTATKADPELYVDSSALAKGFAVDAVTRTLDDAGYENYMVEIGGEVRAKGANAEGDPWRIGIEKPVSEERNLQRVVSLRNEALATSGDYRNFIMVEGERLSHTIDPREGRPVRHRLASVSVVHDQCVYADAYATALMVLGPEEGFEVATEEGLAALFILHDEAGDGFVEKATEAFSRAGSE